VPYVQYEEEVCIILHPSTRSRGYKRVVWEGTYPKPWLSIMNKTLLVLVVLLTKHVVWCDMVNVCWACLSNETLPPLL